VLAATEIPVYVVAQDIGGRGNGCSGLLPAAINFPAVRMQNTGIEPNFEARLHITSTGERKLLGASKIPVEVQYVAVAFIGLEQTA
jgi:hypothetical protein